MDTDIDIETGTEIEKENAARMDGVLDTAEIESALAELGSATGSLEAVLRGSANSYPLRRNGFRVQKCFPPQI